MYNHVSKDKTINSLPNVPNYVDFCPLSAHHSGKKKPVADNLFFIK